MTSLRDQAGQVALAEGIKTNFCINKSGISAAKWGDLSWTKSQAKSLSGAFYRTSVLGLGRGIHLRNYLFVSIKKVTFFENSFPPVYGTISVEIL